MTGRIPQPFLDDLLTRVDIVALVSAHVQLRKTGKNYSACCPFHSEKTPSFTVSPNKQFYHCFGCGAHGNAIGFLMEYDKLPFVDAVETLAKQAGLSLPKEFAANPKQESHKQFYQLLEQATQYYQTQLRQHPNAKVAIDYLKKRGLTGQIAKAYGLGYAPTGWDNLIKQIGKKYQNAKEYQNDLITVGLAISKDGGRCYDRFRERIMFPIRDSRGRIIGFGGRVLDQSTPKYLNSPETPIFHKGSELYGLYEVLQRTRKLESLLLVEGYMDVIALAQHGIDNAVASLGTATTRQHLERAFRHVSTVIFCFDGDAAGQEAASRALETTLPLLEDGREVKFMFLPQGEDPDTVIRSEGHDGFVARINTAIPFSEFFFRRLEQDVPLTSPDSRARLAKHAKPLIERLPQGVFRQMLIDQLAKKLGLDQSQLGTIAPPEQSAHAKQASTSKSVAELTTRSPLRHAITLLLNRPDLIKTVQDVKFLHNLTVPGVAILIELIQLLQKQASLKTGAILEYWRDRPEYAALSKLASQEIVLPEATLVEEFKDTLLRLAQHAFEQRMELLLAKASREGLSNAEKHQLQDLIARCRVGIKTTQTDG